MVAADIKLVELLTEALVHQGGTVLIPPWSFGATGRL